MAQLRHGPLLLLLLALSGADPAGMTERSAPMLTRRRERCVSQASSPPQMIKSLDALV